MSIAIAAPAVSTNRRIAIVCDASAFNREIETLLRELESAPVELVEVALEIAADLIDEPLGRLFVSLLKVESVPAMGAARLLRLRSIILPGDDLRQLTFAIRAAKNVLRGAHLVSPADVVSAAGEEGPGVTRARPAFPSPRQSRRRAAGDQGKASRALPRRRALTPTPAVAAALERFRDLAARVRD